MKTFKPILIGVLFSLSYLCSGAQEENIPLNQQPNYNKARLFEDQPQKIDLKVTDLESLFDLPVGSDVTAKFSKSFYLRGNVVSKSVTETIKSVVIKAANRRGAVFTFTKVIKQDGSFTYKGRILSKDNSDAYDIVKENDQYILQKKNYHEIVSE
jgi:hypothetical protein